MVNKRKYKVLTKAQSAKVKRYTKQGKSQGVIARALGVSKQRVANAQRKIGVGKRIASPFWKDVAKYKADFGWSHKKATQEVMGMPKWRAAYKKRTGKVRISRKDVDEGLLKKVRKAFKDITGEEWQRRKGTADEGRVAVEHDGTEYIYLGEK